MGEIKRSAQGDPGVVASSAAPIAPAATTADSKSDQTSVSLKPGEGIEIKLEMDKGARVQYRWVARGGVVTFDAHGEGSEVKFSVSYKKGQDAQQDEGTLEAVFKGQHGWNWKNRGMEPVTVELNTVGHYSSIRRVL